MRDKLCSLALSKRRVIFTKNELRKAGISINSALKENILRLRDDGTYILWIVDYLYNYGLNLDRVGFHEKAEIVYLLCTRIDPNHLEANQEVFSECLKRKNYEKALIFFDNILDLDNPDHKFILYLFYMITDLPDGLKELASHIGYDDLDLCDEFKLPKSDFEEEMSKIKLESLYQSFGSAAKRIFDYLSMHGKQGPLFSVFARLLKEAHRIQRVERAEELKLVRGGKYEELYNYLKSIENKHRLSLYDQAVMDVTKDIIRVKETGEIPVKVESNFMNRYQLIRNHDYRTAMEISYDNVAGEKHSLLDSVLFILLKDMVKLISPLEDKEQDSADEEFCKEIFKTLERDGLVILDSLDRDRRIRLYSILCGYDNVLAFEFGEGEERTVVVKYRIVAKRTFDEDNVKAHECKASGDLEGAIRYFRKMLDTGFISDSLLKELGELYYKTGNANLAIKYLTVAKYVALEQGLERNCDELINQITESQGNMSI